MQLHEPLTLTPTTIELSVSVRIAAMNLSGVGSVAPASWTAVMSEANHRFGLGLAIF